jgi:hypothetical protein
MDEKVKELIKKKLSSIYSLTDEILALVNTEGAVKLRYPFGSDQKEVEEAIFHYIESHTQK